MDLLAGKLNTDFGIYIGINIKKSKSLFIIAIEIDF
jgi:hypothetical protein